MTVTVNDVQRIRDEHVALGRTPSEVVMGTRTAVHALLQLEHPFPGPDQVTDAHRIASDRARALDPNHTDAHHWLQKEHGKALWKQADALCREAGVL
jgi:hypothetical protein